MDRDNIKEFEKSFYKTFKLSKNNPTINLELHNYFVFKTYFFKVRKEFLLYDFLRFSESV